MISASHDDSATQGWRLLAHVIAALNHLNNHPDVECFTSQLACVQRRCVGAARSLSLTLRCCRVAVREHTHAQLVWLNLRKSAPAPRA